MFTPQSKNKLRNVSIAEREEAVKMRKQFYFQIFLLPLLFGRSVKKILKFQPLTTSHELIHLIFNIHLQGTIHARKRLEKIA